MKKIAGICVLSLAAIFGSGNVSAANYAWPENFEGVMLQGFYWDSYNGTNNTKWTTLTQNADELSKYFKLIWVPNGAKAATSPSNGYDPVYWFSNYNTCWGTEANLRKMIQTFKEKGTGIIADVVINHRSGVSNWTNFPTETWNGQTYKLGPEHICNTDEVRNESGQAKPTGAADTGEDFNGSRDLDHTSAEVQRNCKAYCQFLLQDMGYAGFRLDMVKGYGGQYTKMYNEASKPTYSVGEYFDGNYDLVKNWIEATGRQSAAFDFPQKFALNEAFNSNDMTKLVWNANGTTPQPAGMIHFAYQQYAVTFVDNHDTYRDDWNKFKGNVVAGNAFILCSPGTPCVFYKHYIENKAAIQKLISIRNSVGVHNMSAVKVLQSTRDCYMAEVTGTKGKLVVKIGSAMVSPQGYSDSDIKASGTGYCVWTKTGVVIDPTPGPDPDPSGNTTCYFRNTEGWSSVSAYVWVEGTEDSVAKWPGQPATKVSGDVWSYTFPAKYNMIIFNDGSNTNQTDDFNAVNKHIYEISGDKGDYGGDTPTPGNYPETLYLIGNVNGTNWASATGVFAQDSKKDGVYTWNKVTVDDAGEGSGYFSFLTQKDSVDGEWTTANDGDRYGSEIQDAPLTLGQTATVVLFPANVSAMGATAWKVPAGEYTVVVDLKNMTIRLAPSTTAIDSIGADDAAPVYFNLQGVRVDNPENGLFIVVRGNKVTREVIR